MWRISPVISLDMVSTEYMHCGLLNTLNYKSIITCVNIKPYGFIFTVTGQKSQFSCPVKDTESVKDIVLIRMLDFVTYSFYSICFCLVALLYSFTYHVDTVNNCKQDNLVLSSCLISCSRLGHGTSMAEHLLAKCWVRPFWPFSLSFPLNPGLFSFDPIYTHTVFF